MTNYGYTTITYPVSIQDFDYPAPDPLNDESFRVVIAQPMDETPVQKLSPLTEAYGSVLGEVISHAMDSYTVDMHPPHPIPRFLPVPLPTLPLPPIIAPHTPLPQSCSPGVRPMTRSHSTGEKDDFHGRKWF